MMWRIGALTVNLIMFPHIIDSDNDLEVEDDDLYQQYTDQEPKDDKTIIP